MGVLPRLVPEQGTLVPNPSMKSISRHKPIASFTCPQIPLTINIGHRSKNTGFSHLDHQLVITRQNISRKITLIIDHFDKG